LVMEQARVCLAPLRFGAGIKGKLLDAMLMQTPSITTSIGSEGMHGEEPWPGMITDNTDQFIEAAVTLYSDEKQWQLAQSQASTVLQNNYDRDTLSQRLASKIDLAIKNLDINRSNNFTGSMLRHHSMMSTKYMSQWIAAKNALSDDKKG